MRRFLLAEIFIFLILGLSQAFAGELTEQSEFPAMTIIAILLGVLLVLIYFVIQNGFKLRKMNQEIPLLDKNKMILNKLPIWIAVLNREGKYLFLHDANIDNTPLAKRKVGKTIFDLYDVSYALKILETVDNVIKDNETRRLEYKRFSEGPWLLGTCVKLNDSIYGEQAVLWTADNINNQKQAREELELKNKIIDIIQKNVETKYERDFLVKLTENMSEALKADCVFVADFIEKAHENHCETIIFSGEQCHHKHAEFKLSATLKEELEDKAFFQYPQQVSSIFKDETVLFKRSIKHGVGVTLRSSTNQVTGIICALFKGPVQDLSFVNELLRIFADRAGSELERENAEKMIKEGKEKYKNLFANVNISLLRLDTKWNILELNNEAKVLLDTEKDVVGQNFLEHFVSQEAQIKLNNEVQDILEGKSKCGYLMNINTFSGIVKNVIWNIVREGREVSPTGFILSGIDMTERRETADKLYKLREDLAYHEHHLRITLASLGEGVITTDTNGTIMEMNPSAEDITGWNSLAAKGNDIHDIFHIIASKREMHPYDEVIKIAKGIMSYDEITIQSHNSAEYRLAFTASPIRDSAGKSHGVVLVFRNVGEEIEQRKQLEEAHSLLQQLLDNLPVYVYVKDPDDDFRYIYVNYEIGKKNSLLPSNVLGKTDFDIFQADEAEALHVNDELSLQKERVICEETVTAVTGEKKQLRTIRTLIRTDEKKSILMGISLDITEQVEAEKAVRRNEARLSAIMANSPYLVLLLDQQYRPVYFNKKALEITGYTEEEMWEQSLDSLTPQKYREKSEHFLEKLFIEKREFVTFEEYLQCANNNTCPVRVTYVPIYSDTSANFNLLVFAEDIHGTREMERQLHHAQRMESVGRLAGGVAHDFNNLLQVIIGLADFLKETVKPESEEAEMVTTLMNASESATELVSQLLLFSRKEPGEKESISIAETTRNFLKMVRRVIGQDIQVSFSAEESIYDVYADRRRIEQVLMNLCINSKDAIAKGNGEIAISIHNEQVIHEWRAFNGNIPRGNYVVLKVEDNGSGIRQENLDKIFDPFYTTKDPGKGTGLGLSTVFGIVEDHKGYINVKSTLGKGTTLIVYLPQYRTTIAGHLREQRKVIAGNGKSLTILYAEDDPLVRNLMVKTLTLSGHKILIAENGRQAVELFEEHTDEIQLCIFDIIMPEMGGDEAYQCTLQINPNTPVIFTTGYAGERLSQYVWNSKFVEILQKPFVANELNLAINKIVKRIEKHSTNLN